jgi:hypothetical protein
MRNDTEATEVKGSLVKATLLGGVAATAANAVLYHVWAAALGPLRVAESPESAVLAPLPVGFVLLSSAVPALFAGGLFALLRRVGGPRAVPVFLGLSGVVLVLSMAPVVEVPTDGLATQAGLTLMHGVAALCIAWPLVRAGRRAPPAAGGVA